MLFQLYGETAGYQLLGFVLVFTGLVLANEFARRTKTGGIICFLALPAVLTVYFIAIYIGAANGAEWALNNQTYTNMNSWFHYAKLYAATAGCIGFMMLKYKWSIGKTDWFKVFPFAIVAINILIAVASDFESGIRGAKAMMEFGDRWWLSSENVWLYGGWWNWVNGIAGQNVGNFTFDLIQRNKSETAGRDVDNRRYPARFKKPDYPIPGCKPVCCGLKRDSYL